MLRHFWVVLMAVLVTVGVASCGGDESPDNTRLMNAFTEGRTGVWVSGHGTVVRPLGADATNQRFLVRIDEGFSVVIRYRIGDAGAIPADRGDQVQFQGRYEFHGGGGEILLTHADPAQPGGGGWIVHDGRRYD